MPLMLNDSALASAMMAGEVNARQAAWFHFAPMVRRILRSSLPGFLEMDDLVQEVFLQLFCSLPRLRDPQALRGFVITIAVRTGKDHRRRGWRRLRTELPITPEQLSWEPVACDDVPRQHALLRVEHLLRKLRQCDRVAFVLRFVEGMTNEEVASALGTSTITVRRRCSRARLRLELLAQRDLFLAAYVTSGSSQQNVAVLEAQVGPHD